MRASSELLRATRRIAVVGRLVRSGPALVRRVPATSCDQGFDCVPVNPNERAVMGIPAFPTIAEAVDATGPFDMVDVFRRPEQCPRARP